MLIPSASDKYIFSPSALILKLVCKFAVSVVVGNQAGSTSVQIISSSFTANDKNGKAVKSLEPSVTLCTSIASIFSPSTKYDFINASSMEKCSGLPPPYIAASWSIAEKSLNSGEPASKPFSAITFPLIYATKPSS